jgi:tRNA G18 (ribose-2'-O)-methylase SpoU
MVVPEAIADPDDPRLLLYRNVSDAELLRTKGVFLVEGRLVVRRLLTSSRFRPQSVLVTSTAHAALEDVLERTTAPVYVVPQVLLNDSTGFNIHRGCLAIGERGADPDWRQLVPGARRVVVLERVADADNVGSIFRNAAAFGVDAVLLDPVSTDPLYRKAIRTSMGSALSLPFARVAPWPESLNTLRQQGLVVIGLTPGANQSVRDVVARRSSIDRGMALLVGHEGDGLSQAALDQCDETARIPMSGSVDSLNVATAAAVALYELSSHR